ncbi:type IX secretion system anionic LPS delivery protein PorZ [Gaetbulibacter aestuarii]|uniref:Two-component regulator propeller domain-containing protein n=1 Tax=Gaetbulibacter aestuarii TaxID=1502358 RepID=A0ABW7MVX6_9FLAO
MIKKSLILLFFAFSFSGVAQDFSASWTGHFSFYNVSQVIQGNNKIYAVADNAIFTYDPQTNATEQITTINGLSGETISSVYYSVDYGLLLIGYSNGLMEVVFDNDDKVLSVVDIVDKITIPQNAKRINHFDPYGNVVYVSTNFGISVFNLERLEFGDTYFIGSSGEQIIVNETAILGDYIYAACSNNNGIKKALVTSPNLVDYNNWQTVTTGDYLQMDVVQDQLYTLRNNRSLYKINNDVLSEVASYTNLPSEVKAANGVLLVTTKSIVYAYDANFNLQSQVNVSSDFNTIFQSATILGNEMFIGTKDFGVLSTNYPNPTIFIEIHPDGPLLNSPFKLQTIPNGLWVTFGEYSVTLNPYPLNSRGVSYYDNNSWTNTPYTELFDAKSLNFISVNPENNNQVFISSFFSGLLKFEDGLPVVLYNESNSGLESLQLPNDPSYTDIRVGASEFDSNGLLWTLTSLINAPLKSYNPTSNQWQSFSFKDIIPAEFGSNLGFSDLVIDSDQTKWIASFNYGVIAVKTDSGSPQIKNIVSDEQNMPDTYVTALAIDKRNQLWIGTYKGLRVLYNPSDFFTNSNPQVDNIIIKEDGIAKELLFQQFITDIEVDGGNNKWIGTDNSGLFYFSSDGQKTIYHFTTDNSPLPSNRINDISLNSSNGEVYIATPKGLVSFDSGSSGPANDLANAYVYPNPVRPGFNMAQDKIKIVGLSDDINIKITDIEGNLVTEAQSRINDRYSGYNLEIDGGTAYWNGKNLANNDVASGVYLIMLSDLETFETQVLKVMIVR